MRRKLLPVVIFVAPGWMLSAQADRSNADAVVYALGKPYIEAVGEASIQEQPDQALIEISVVSQGATAAAAAAQNAKQTDACLTDLTGVLGSRKNLKTTSYSVQPNYRYPKPGGEPTIDGYNATNSVQITLDDLSQVSKVIDAATKSGANNVRNLQYQLKDPSAARARVLQQAAQRGRTNVEAIAAGLGLKITRILSAAEVQQGPMPILARNFSPQAAAAPSTPIEIGTIEVSAHVVVRAEIAQ